MQKPPQIVASFLQPEPEQRDRLSYSEVQAMLRRRVVEMNQFSRGSVLDTLERGGGW